MKTALLVGGTGPTGPFLVQGLLDRGYQLSLFHRGVHELDDLPPVEHIHGDPHFQETIAEALAGRTFDLVIAAYGRVRYLAEFLAGRCDRFLGVGGFFAYRGIMEPGQLRPYGARVPIREIDHPADAYQAGVDSDAARFSHLVYSAERQVFAVQDRGGFRATYFRYPVIYGPRQVYPHEWSVVKRALDGREWIIVPDGGLAIVARCAAQNAAHTVLLAVDQPAASAGKVYNCADDQQLTLRQWVELIVEYAGGRSRVISLPEDLAGPARAFLPLQGASTHSLLDTSLVRQDLGYVDAVSVQTALRETVEWLIANPVTPEQYPTFHDAFDYAYEDRLIAAYQSHLGQLQRDHPYLTPDAKHPYAHPKNPREPGDHRGR